MTLDYQQDVVAREEGVSLFKLLEHRNEEPAVLSLQDFLRRRHRGAAVGWVLINQDLFCNILSGGKLRCLRVLFDYAPEMLLHSSNFNVIAWCTLTGRSDRHNTALQHALVQCLTHGLAKAEYTDLPRAADDSVRLSALELFGKPDDYIRCGPSFSYTLAGAHSYRRLPVLDFLDDTNNIFRDYVLTFYVAMAALEDKLEQVPSHAPHSTVHQMLRACSGTTNDFDPEVAKKLLTIVHLNSLAPCSDAVTELQSIFKSGLFCAIMHGISTRRAHVAAGYWRNVWRARYASLCFALQPLALPAPVLLAIADAAAPWLIAVALPHHYKWSTIVHIKHARETGKL